MKAQETTLKELLEGTKQYQVPLYQRTYSWVKEQHERACQLVCVSGVFTGRG